MQNALLKIMAEVSAARESLMCPEGHFHPVMSSAEMLIILADLAQMVEVENAWDDDDQREAVFTALGQIAHVTRTMLKENPDPMSTEEVMAKLHLETEAALPFVAAAIGLGGTMPVSELIH